MKLASQKTTAASLSVACNLGLCGLKLIGAAATGSVGLLSEGIHSLTDVASSLLALVSVKAASVPADETHPYGHAKIETVAALAEASLLGALSFVVLWHSIEHLYNKTQVHSPVFGVVILAASSLISLIIGAFVSKVAKATRSPVLKSNSFHLFSDSAGSALVGVGIGLVAITHRSEIDALMGIFFSIWLVRGAFKTGYDSFQELIDRSLPAKDLELIRSTLSKAEGVISFHKLRTRMTGFTKLVDVHIVLPNTWSLVQSHEIADRLEKQIREALAPAEVIIHVDPFDEKKLKAPMKSASDMAQR